MAYLKEIKIRKRKVERTVLWPERGGWRFPEQPDARFFRFGPVTTTYIRGRLRIVFDQAGVAIEAWSYYTCIYTRAEPSEDYPYGRVIYNGSGYGSTTGKHEGTMRYFFEGYGDQVEITRKVYSRVQKVVRVDHHKAYSFTDYQGVTHLQPAWDHEITRATQAYTSKVETERRYLMDVQQAVQIGWGRGATPDDLREQLRLDTRTPKQVAAEQRKAMRAAKARAKYYAEQTAAWEAAQAKHAERGPEYNTFKLTVLGI